MIDAYFSGTKIRWTLHNVPGAMERARDGEILFGNIDTWLIWKLTHGAVHVTDYTNASRTMLMDLESGEWSDDLLASSTCPGQCSPRIVSSSGRVGTISPGISARQFPSVASPATSRLLLPDRPASAPVFPKTPTEPAASP